MPGTDPPVLVTADDVVGWERLSDSLRGAAEATTTTLLSALWPEHHFVFDWRVFAAANALRLDAGELPTPGIEADSARTPSLTFDDYGLIREWLLATSVATGEPLRSVERALYNLSRQVPGMPGRTWREYASEIAAELTRER